MNDTRWSYIVYDTPRKDIGMNHIVYMGTNRKKASTTFARLRNKEIGCIFVKVHFYDDSLDETINYFNPEE